MDGGLSKMCVWECRDIYGVLGERENNEYGTESYIYIIRF